MGEQIFLLPPPLVAEFWTSVSPVRDPGAQHNPILCFAYFSIPPDLAGGACGSITLSVSGRPVYDDDSLPLLSTSQCLSTSLRTCLSPRVRYISTLFLLSISFSICLLEECLCRTLYIYYLHINVSRDGCVCCLSGWHFTSCILPPPTWLEWFKCRSVFSAVDLSFTSIYQ